MKPILTIVLVLLTGNLAVAGKDKGTVTSVDGKSGFEVATERNGVITFRAGKDIMGDEPAIKFPDWPHVYKSLMKGDYIEMTWGKGNDGKPIATGLRIIKRGG